MVAGKTEFLDDTEIYKRLLETRQEWSVIWSNQKEISKVDHGISVFKARVIYLEIGSMQFYFMQLVLLLGQSS